MRLAPVAAAARTCAGDGSMNSDTGRPASKSSATPPRRPRAPPPPRPPPAGRPPRVEPALGGPLLAPLGHEGHDVGPEAPRDAHHVRGRGHLEVQDRPHRLPQELEVAVLQVPAILAEVTGDAVRAGELAQRR